jgi:hypothetical protein
MLRYSLYNEDQIREPDLAESYGSDNSTAADNQQERLSVSEKKCWFLAGLIEGEGSLCVSIKNHKPSRFGYLVHPEFFIPAQNSKGLVRACMQRVWNRADHT